MVLIKISTVLTIAVVFMFVGFFMGLFFCAHFMEDKKNENGKSEES